MVGEHDLKDLEPHQEGGVPFRTCLFLLHSRAACYVSDVVQRYVLILISMLGCGKRSCGFD
jgi:hypothetical protein